MGNRKTSFFTRICTIAMLLVIAAGIYYVNRPHTVSAEQLSGRTMGTTYNIKCWIVNSSIDSPALQADIDRRLKQINQQMSTYLSDSELSRFNAAPADEWFNVSPSTAYVTERALHYHHITGGCSDVTVGPLLKLWDFGPGRGTAGSKLESPSEALLASARANTGGEHLEARLNPPALKKAKGGLQVDLSSIAKGYAVDVVAEQLITRGVTNFMVEIGGEVRAGGTRPDGKPWRIALEAPDPRQRTLHRVVKLDNRALATSGDYRNFRDFAGEKVSHIINPKTGRPLPYRGWSVTLLTPTCLEADALATALLVMGEDRGYDWCVEHKIAALFLLRVDAGIVEKATPGFPDLERLNGTASEGK
ncbi:MAG: FAD:protein FMN transferase [Bythopirellula sp.]